MITELLMQGFKELVSILLTPLSIVLMPIGSMAGFIELLAYASIFIPMSTLAVSFTIYLAYYGVQFAVSIVNWVISKIPTIN